MTMMQLLSRGVYNHKRNTAATIPISTQNGESEKQQQQQQHGETSHGAPHHSSPVVSAVSPSASSSWNQVFQTRKKRSLSAMMKGEEEEQEVLFEGSVMPVENDGGGGGDGDSGIMGVEMIGNGPLVVNNNVNNNSASSALLASRKKRKMFISGDSDDDDDNDDNIDDGGGEEKDGGKTSVFDLTAVESCDGDVLHIADSRSPAVVDITGDSTHLSDQSFESAISVPTMVQKPTSVVQNRMPPPVKRQSDGTKSRYFSGAYSSSPDTQLSNGGFDDGYASMSMYYGNGNNPNYNSIMNNSSTSIGSAGNGAGSGIALDIARDLSQLVQDYSTLLNEVMDGKTHLNVAAHTKSARDNLGDRKLQLLNRLLGFEQSMSKNTFAHTGIGGNSGPQWSEQRTNLMSHYPREVNNNAQAFDEGNSGAIYNYGNSSMMGGLHTSMQYDDHSPSSFAGYNDGSHHMDTTQYMGDNNQYTQDGYSVDRFNNDGRYGSNFGHSVGLVATEMYPSFDGSQTHDWGSENFPWSKELRTQLVEKFGIRGFRPNQLEAINATLSRRDCFLIMPTGGGKVSLFLL